MDKPELNIDVPELKTDYLPLPILRSDPKPEIESVVYALRTERSKQLDRFIEKAEAKLIWGINNDISLEDNKIRSLEDLFMRYIAGGSLPEWVYRAFDTTPFSIEYGYLFEDQDFVNKKIRRAFVADTDHRLGLDSSFTSACILWCAYCITNNETVTGDNFVRRVLPANRDEAQAFLKHYINTLCFVWLLNVAHTGLAFGRDCDNAEEVETFKESIRRESAKEIQQLKDQLKVALDEANKNKQEVNIKKSQIEELNVKLKSIKNQDAVIRDLERDLAKEKATTQALKAKYDALKASVETDDKDTENEKSLPETKHLDRFSKIVFACDLLKENGPTKEILSKYFPNSCLLIGTTGKINETCDAVVLLTKYLSHDYYSACKEICNKKNIPLRHCREINKQQIERIIKEIPYDER